MYILLVIIHVVVCFVLIGVVLLQAGRGGGFSDMMGGSQPQSIFGTQTNAFMTRATEVSAVLFIITSLSLGILTTQKGKSLMDKRMPVASQEVKKEIAKVVDKVQAATVEADKTATKVAEAVAQDASAATPKTV